MTGEARHVVAEKHDRQQRDAGDAKETKARGLEFNEETEHAQPHEHRRNGVEPDGQLLRPRDVELDDLIAPRAELLPEEIVDILRHACREQRMGGVAVGFRRFAGRERKQFALGLDDHIADLQLVVLVDHGRDHLATVAPALGDRPHAGLQVADDLQLHRLVDILTCH